MDKALRPALILSLLVACWVMAAQYEIDFVVLHHAVKAAVERNFAAIYDPNPHGFLGRFFYPPFSLAFFAPLGHLSFPIAKWAWIVIQTVSFFVLWISLQKLFPYLRKNAGFTVGWFLTFCFAINPIHNNFQSNNVQLILAAFLFGAEVLSRAPGAGRQFLAGFLCPFAGAIKVYPFYIAGYYLVAKPWPTKFGVIAGLAFTSLLPFLYFGPTTGYELYLAFYRNLSTYTTENQLDHVGDILCFPSLLVRWFPLEKLFADGGKMFLKVVTLLPSLALLLWVFIRNRRVRLTPESDLGFWSLACALMVFLNPSTRPHYFIFYVPGFCYLWQGREQVSKSFRYWGDALLGLIFTLIALTAEGVLGKALNDRVEQASIPTLGMGLLCLYLTYRLLRGSTQIELTGYR